MSTTAAGRVLARNTLLNLVGQGFPMLLALIAIPLLIAGFGTDRFGVLTLAWMAIGYFSLFDLGLGRALTQIVAERIGSGREEEVPPLAWTAFLLVMLLGALGAIVLFSMTPWLVGSGLQVPGDLQVETRHTFYLLAFSLPWVVSTAALRGVLEAFQRFDLVNAVRIPMGMVTYLAPLLVLPFSQSLVPVVALLVVGRVLAWYVHLLLCLKTIPALRKRVALSVSEIRPLLRFGGWMTVSNIVSPLMVYMDRFLVGSILSMAAVAYYVTPYEVITKLWIIPVALLGVLFPAFASSFGQDRRHTALLFDRGLRVTFLALFPVTIIAVTLATEGLQLWLGAEFASQSAVVLQWLAIGVFVNSLGQVGFALIQSVGRPDVTAKLHLAELPVYVVALWWLLGRYGIEGAAIAWAARVGMDTVFLLVYARRLLPELAAVRGRVAPMLSLGSVLPISLLVGAQAGLAGKLAFLAIATPVFALIAWLQVLDATERDMIRFSRRTAANKLTALLERA